MSEGARAASPRTPSRQVRKPASGRGAYRDELFRLARRDDRILSVEADLGSGSSSFRKSFPDRFLNLGIAETAAIDVAVGLAAGGFVPFFSTFAPFATQRAAESIKLGLGYMGANVKIAAPYGGVAGAWFGPTHHCLNDLATLQSLPGITLAAPYGEQETRAVVRLAARTEGPWYIRLGRNDRYVSLPGAAELERAPEKLPLPWYSRGEGDTCVVSVGEQGTRVCLETIKVRPAVGHLHLCLLNRPYLEAALPHLRRFRRIIVAEEHRAFGGVGSSMALLLPERRVEAFSCGDAWLHCGGTHEELLAELGFTCEQLVRLVDEQPA